MLQVLYLVFDPGFSETSYGFRPGVNHDMLVAHVARKVKDKRVLRTIRRFLQAGMMEEGLVIPRRAGEKVLE